MPMLLKGFLHLDGRTPIEIDSVELLRLCAEDTDNTAHWSEFLRRFAPKIKHFIRGTLRQILGERLLLSEAPVIFEGIQESDLFQNTIIRLVKNGCAAMRRFSGTTEEELLAYLAIITRSVVRDCVRRHMALKRPARITDGTHTFRHIPHDRDFDISATGPGPEREVLVREIFDLSTQTIKSQSGPSSTRDQLIFQLYFLHGLSISQIAGCKGIDLTKGGVEKALNRLMDRVRTAAAGNGPEAMIP